MERCRAWAADTGRDLLVVFDGHPPEHAPDLVDSGGDADDWLAEHAAEHAPYWLVTSDRELRERAGAAADRIVGGGAFLGELLGV